MSAAPRAEPIYFGREERPLFGWLHRPSPDASPTLAVVLCNPFGHEALAAHRSLRVLAERLAAAGLIALRFDYSGTGNSAGEATDLGNPAPWDDDVHRALECLADQAPGARAALVGLRLGALLALRAAEQGEPLAAAVLIAPPRSGRQYLRELRAVQGATAAAADTAGPGDEALGFPITAGIRQLIEGLDLNGSGLPALERLYLIDRDDLPLGTSSLDVLAARASASEVTRLPGVRALLLDPHESEVPEEILTQTVHWLTTLARRTRLAASETPAPTASGTRSSARVATGLHESAVFLDEDRRLFGILTRHGDSARPASSAFVLVSSGANPTPGPNRLYVSLARRLAAEGHTVLRFDVGGLGDSRPEPGAPEHVVYARGASADLHSAVTYLRERGCKDVRAGGICSGGYHALKALDAGVDLDGITLINPLTFNYVEGMPMSHRPHAAIGEANRYRGSLRSLAAWRKLLTGGVDLRHIARVYGARLRSLSRRLARERLRHSRWALSDDLGRQLEAYAARGVHTHFVFAAGDPGPQLLAEYAGSTVRRLVRQGALTISVIAGPDHTFTLRRHQQALVRVLLDDSDGARNRCATPPSAD